MSRDSALASDSLTAGCDKECPTTYYTHAPHSTIAEYWPKTVDYLQQLTFWIIYSFDCLQSESESYSSRWSVVYAWVVGCSWLCSSLSGWPLRFLTQNLTLCFKVYSIPGIALGPRWMGFNCTSTNEDCYCSSQIYIRGKKHIIR